jgi:hypothetical protein
MPARKQQDPLRSGLPREGCLVHLENYLTQGLFDVSVFFGNAYLSGFLFFRSGDEARL